MFSQMPEDPKPSAPPEESVQTSTNNINIRSNPSILFSRDSLSNASLPAAPPTTQPKRKKKGHNKVISMGMDDEYVPLAGDITKLALVEKAQTMQSFKKEFIENYEMVMGPGSRAKMNKLKPTKPKKEPEPILPKVSHVITKAMESRKRDKYNQIPIHKTVIEHPHPFK